MITIYEHYMPGEVDPLGNQIPDDCTNPYDIKEYITNLSSLSNMYMLVFASKDGIILGQLGVDYPFEIANHQGRLEGVENNQEYLKAKISAHDDEILLLKEDLVLVRRDISKIINSIYERNQKEAEVEVSQEMFLLYDGLPDKIKKELKIYIKNAEHN